MTNGNFEMHQREEEDVATNDVQDIIHDSMTHTLNLEYERVISGSRVFRTIVGFATFCTAVYFLAHGMSITEFIIGACAAAAYIRISIGSIVVVRLTDAAAARVRRWVEEDDNA